MRRWGVTKAATMSPRIVSDITNAIAVAAMLLLAGTMVVQVVLRYVFDNAFVGIEELTSLFGVWVYFPAAACASWTGRHIRAGLLDMFPVGARLMRMLQSAVQLLSAACALFFAWFAAAYAVKTWTSVGQVSPYLGLTKAAWTASMALGLTLIGLAHLRLAFKSERGVS